MAKASDTWCLPSTQLAKRACDSAGLPGTQVAGPAHGNTRTARLHIKLRYILAGAAPYWKHDAGACHSDSGAVAPSWNAMTSKSPPLVWKRQRTGRPVCTSS